MAIPDRVKLPFTFDPILLRRDLDALSSEEWIAHFVEQNYEGDWSAIPLRCAAGARHPIQMIYSDPLATEFVDTPMLQASPYFREALAGFACEVRSVRLLRLTPGSIVKEHTDHDLAAEHGTVRIHIPITTNADVEFELNRVRVVLEPGSAWYLRLSNPHRVANRGTTERVHMVADMVADGWLMDILRRSATESVNETALPV